MGLGHGYKYIYRYFFRFIQIAFESCVFRWSVAAIVYCYFQLPLAKHLLDCSTMFFFSSVCAFSMEHGEWSVSGSWLLFLLLQLIRGTQKNVLHIHSKVEIL